jgi:RsmE family RNA methyltransferase
MNLLLLRPEEVDPALAEVRLTGRRADHVRDVLRASPGRTLRCGLLDGPLGVAIVTRVGRDEVVVRCSFDPSPPPRPEDVLLLAAPRPKVLRRVVEDAAALGYGTIVVLRTWRVDRSHLESRAVDPLALDPHALAGLEQGRRTWRPRILVEPLFRPFVEDRLDRLLPAGERLVADPDAAIDIAGRRPTGPFSLAIGPERGFTPYEIAALTERGFVAVHAGPHPLRVEAAVAALTATLCGARRCGAVDRRPGLG